MGPLLFQQLCPQSSQYRQHAKKPEEIQQQESKEGEVLKMCEREREN